MHLTIDDFMTESVKVEAVQLNSPRNVGTRRAMALNECLHRGIFDMETDGCRKENVEEDEKDEREAEGEYEI